MNYSQEIINNSRKNIKYAKRTLRKAQRLNDLYHRYIVLLAVDNLMSDKEWGREADAFIILGFWKKEHGQPFCPYGPQIIRYNDVVNDSDLRGYASSVTCYLPKSYAVKYTHKLNTRHGYNNHATLMTVKQFLEKFKSMHYDHADI